MCVLKNISPYNIIKRKKIRQNYPSPFPASTHVFFSAKRSSLVPARFSLHHHHYIKAWSSLFFAHFASFFSSFRFIFHYHYYFFLNYQILHTNFNHTNRALNHRDKSLSIISRLLLIRYFYIRVPLPGSLLRSLSSLGNEVKQTTFSSSNLVE